MHKFPDEFRAGNSLLPESRHSTAPAVSVLILALPENEPLGRRVGELAQIPLGVVESRRFPDRETYLRIDAECEQKNIAVVCTLDRPDEKLLPLVFLADAVRELGASRVGLVAPHLPYLRQDRQFRHGEAVTSRTFAGLLSRYPDWRRADRDHDVCPACDQSHRRCPAPDSGHSRARNGPKAGFMRERCR